MGSPEHKKQSLWPFRRKNTGVVRPPVTSGKEGKEEEDVLDFRDVPPSLFMLQPFLDDAQQAQLTIGGLYVHVVEAQGLIAGDLNGKSDPYCRLKLTGHFLSHGQEWPVRHQHWGVTDVCNRTLSPLWDEEFRFPIWRAGAVLRIWVYDWDRRLEDDLLGCVEVPLRGELMCQQVVDKWFPLQPYMSGGVPNDDSSQSLDIADDDTAQQRPISLQMLSNAAGYSEDRVVGSEFSDADGGGMTAGEVALAEAAITTAAAGAAALDGAKRVGRSGRAGGSLDGDSARLSFNTEGASVKKRAFGLPRRKKNLEAKNGDVSSKGERSLGLIKLRLWFQFDELGEFCSHMWLEDPFRPELERFSPNRFWRKVMRVWHLFQPYVKVLKLADDVVSWVVPRQSFQWMGLVLLVLAFPPLGFVLLHGFGYWVLFTNYLSYQAKVSSVEDEGTTAPRPSSSPAPPRLSGFASGGGGAVGSYDAKDGNGNSAGGKDSIAEQPSESGDVTQNTAARAHFKAGVQATVAAQRLGKTQATQKEKELIATPVRKVVETTDDIELLELEAKLQGSRQFHTVINEVGKRFGKKNGPIVQHKLEVLAVDLIQFRKLWHPHTLTFAMIMSVGLLLHFSYISFMYWSGRFNLYIASLLFAYFTRKFIKKRGRAAYLGLRQAIDNRKLMCELKGTASSAGRGVTIRTVVNMVGWKRRAAASIAEQPAPPPPASSRERSNDDLAVPRARTAASLFGDGSKKGPRVIGGRRRKRRIIRYDRVFAALLATVAMTGAVALVWHGTKKWALKTGIVLRWSASLEP